MRLSIEDVRKVAGLSKLEIADSQLEGLAGKLLNVLELVDQLQQADTRGIEEMAHPVDVHSVVRNDELRSNQSPEEGLQFRDAVLQIAPRTDGEFFLVPPVLG